METKKHKHMTLDDRIEIQECLYRGMSFKDIGKRIGKDQTTISKEVKLHAKTQISGFTKTDETCPKLLKAPFICNGCSKCSNVGCKYPQRKYTASLAQNEYEDTLVLSREGTPLNKRKFYDTEEIISDAVSRGQHIYHAIKANDLTVSKSTVYRHIEKGYYRISKIDLPRAVKFKPRKSKQQDYVPKGAKIGRTYDVFREFILFFCNPNSPHQKPHVENNHTLLRDIVPSGTSFDDFTQETVNLIFSHINSIKRKQFNGKSAYELFAFTYSDSLAATLGISYIEPNSVIQSPVLLY